MTTENQASSFNEKGALKELERLQQAIADSRRRRGETVEQFNAFVRSFSKPAGAPAAPALERPVQATAIVREPPPEPAAQEVRVEPLAAAIEPPRADRLDPLEIPAKRQSIAPPWLLATIAILVVIGALMLLRGRPSTSARPTPSATDAAAPAPTSSPAAAPAAHAPAVKPGGIQAELTTARPVWVRVLSDGQKVIERELKVNERIPVRAEQTLTIRAGDAGALRVSIGGQDQGPLGRDGVIANRTFTARAPATPSR